MLEDDDTPIKPVHIDQTPRPIKGGTMVVRNKKRKEIASFDDHIVARHWLKKNDEAWDVMRRKDNVVLSTKGARAPRSKKDDNEGSSDDE